MSAPKPDPIVREPEARASVEELTKGLAEDARANGVLPPLRHIEEFAKEITREQIARHEERFRNGVPDASPARQEPAPGDTGGPARLDRGTFVDELGEARRVERPFDPERHSAKTKIVPLSEAIESRLVDARLRLLLSWETHDGKQIERFPEWAERLRKTWTETQALSKNLGLPKKESESNAADAVLKILDESSARFGDWRNPKGPDGQPLYFFFEGA